MKKKATTAKRAYVKKKKYAEHTDNRTALTESERAFLLQLIYDFANNSDSASEVALKTLLDPIRLKLDKEKK
jgi:ribosomal protein L18